jgi:hypothetical protein
MSRIKVKILSNLFSNHFEIKLKINSKKKGGKYTNIWKFKNTLLDNKIRKYLEISEKENTTNQKLRDEAKVVLRRKF